jgi:tetratricopeptide (TPR) repeat protein
MSRNPSYNALVRAAVALVWVAVLFSPAPAEGWWNSRWKARRTIQCKTQHMKLPGEEVGYVQFETFGLAKPDGSDIRVLRGSKVLPHYILNITDTGRVDFVFETVWTASTYEIYFGNPEAGPPPHQWHFLLPGEELAPGTTPWEPMRGLFLETRRYKGGEARNPAQAAATVARSGPRTGGGPVKRIFGAGSPWGPTDNTVFLYRGHFVADEAGTYDMSLTCNHAGFLYIDGKNTLGWGGWHGRVADSRHHRKIDLARGLHKIAFYNVNRWGRPAQVVAWKTPRDAGRRRFEIMPPKAFPDLFDASIKDYELRGRGTQPDFTAESRSMVNLDPDGGNFMVRMAFTDLTGRATRRTAREVHWDFGDGQSATGEDPIHIYLTEGIYTVTLTLRMGRMKLATTGRIRAERNWELETKWRVDRRDDYARIVAAYDLEKLPPADLANAFYLFYRVGDHAMATRVGKLLLLADVKLDPKLRINRTHQFAEVLLQHSREYPAAEQLYAAAESRLPAAEHSGRLAMAVSSGDVALNYRKDLKAALAAYTRALEDYADAARPPEKRKLYVAIGNVYLYRGDHAKAKTWFEKAAAIPVVKRSAEEDILRKSTYARTMESYLVKGELEFGETALRTWEWEYPLDKLDGYLVLLRARYHAAKEELDEAAFLANVVVAVNPRSNYADQALDLGAKWLERLGRYDEAVARLETLKADYPESPLTKGLNTRITFLRGKAEGAKRRGG